MAATTFPMLLSAVGSLMAAILLANKSIWEVPKATRVMAVISFFNPTKHPKTFAKSLKCRELFIRVKFPIFVSPDYQDHDSDVEQ